MKIKVAQASDRIVIKLENGRDIEIAFYAADGMDVPSQCRISSNGRENARRETQPTGKMVHWEFTLPD